jgi:5-oxoprolinase (ATP-hydrolysing)
MQTGWRIWIDRGGTFTDVVAIHGDGTIKSFKLLSERPGQYDDSVREGIRRVLLGHRSDDTIGPGDIQTVKVGTTVATNAILEGTGEPTLFVTTKGFRDTLEIGDQSRPDLFSLETIRPAPLYGAVVEADERIAADGSILVPLDSAALAEELHSAVEAGLRSVAIAFLHSFRNPVHEQTAAELARAIGFKHITLSSEINPLIRFLPRAQTTVVDAFLTPVVRKYFDGLAQAFPARLFFMQSNGGLTRGDRIHGSRLVYSGPAGGVVGMKTVGVQEGFGELIGFDMGGTSTDVSIFDGTYDRSEETLVRNLHLRAPSLTINSVAAGGGSIVWFDGMRLRVGDDSAGAIPGPAAYGNGGPATITDCQVVLGRLQPAVFPPIFGPNSDQPLDIDSARLRLAELQTQVAGSTGQDRESEQLALEFVDIAVRRMAHAIRRLTIARGTDPTNFALVAFGGAAGQHACAIADELQIQTVLVPAHAGLLSAIGIGLAEVVEVQQRTVGASCTRELLDQLGQSFETLADQVAGSIRDQGVAGSAVATLRWVFLRQDGTDTSIRIPMAPLDELLEAFRASFRDRYGFEASTSADLILETIEVEGTGTLTDGRSPLELSMPNQRDVLSVGREYQVWFLDGPHKTHFIPREHLAGGPVEGPAIIVDPDSTTVVEPGWTVDLSERGTMRMTRQDARRDQAWSSSMHPHRLEVFQNLFMHIAEQMGDQLRATARSVNIRERLDYSCALFDSNGGLVANAPHIPVHLGSMSETVIQLIRERRKDLRPGISLLSNNPFRGGTHVPDLTVVTPVFEDVGVEPVAFVASRAHHADIGGILPGSMPPNAASIDEEGVVFDGMVIVADGVFQQDRLRRALASGKFPARNPDTNIADLIAQLAANQTGVAAVLDTMSRYGLEVVRAYMSYVHKNAESVIREMLRRLDGGAFSVVMDSGQKIAVRIDVNRDEGEAIIDFSGTSEQGPNSLNAPRAITSAAVLYVLRCLAGSDIPLNAGCLEPIRIVLPPGSILDPRPPAAVAGGNVETSQCIVDALLGALGAQAGSQGTMNNVTFGNDARQYYETICGGTGAGPDFNGAAAVHSHMTNSRITDIEILEDRMPVVVEEFAIRKGSGGRGRRHGGDGATRRIRFEEDMTIAILSNRRIVAPHGLSGGEQGSAGVNTLIRKDGTREDLGPTGSLTVRKGDVLLVETPGGGGFDRQT